MKKIFSRVLGVFYTFILLFCLTGCSIFPGWTFNSGDGGGSSSGGSDDTNDNSGGDDYNPVVDDPEFEQDEEGNYTYFSDYIASYDGVRILSVPPVGAESGNSVTDAERERFYTNVSAQFEILSEYILYYLAGEFGGGTNARSVSSWDGDYVTELQGLIPTNRLNPDGEDIYDSNAYVIERAISGWTYDGTTLTPVYDASKQWALILDGGYSESDPQGYADAYVEKYRYFVQIRLMEMVLNDLYGTTYNTGWDYASNYDDATSLIEEYIVQFTKLGFIFDNISDEIKDLILNDFIGSTAINYDESNKTLHEPLFGTETLTNDVDGDGVYDPLDGDTFTDLNGNGTFDGQIYFDINGNGVYDASFASSSYFSQTDDEGFYVGYSAKIDDLITNISYIVNGESGNETSWTDGNGNSYFDKGYISIYAMEVQDLASEDYFTPGVEATDETPRKLNNMPYAQYQSAMFLPSELEDGETTKFDCLTIYVDSETDFSMKIWLKVHTGGFTFTVPLCILNLNSEEDCDWANEDETKVWTGDEESWTTVEELFDDRERNAVWDMDLSVLLSEEYYSMITETGVGAYAGTLDYTGRGYHTNSVDNTELKDLYDLFNITDGEDDFYSFLSSSEDTYFEFVFEILDEQPDEEYNFKFLIMPIFWDIANIDEDFIWDF